jgi:hypothetical protein
LAHLVLSPWPTAVLARVLARRPGLAAAAAGATVLRLDRQVEDLPAAAALVGQSVRGTGLGLGRALALLGPLAWLAAVRDRRVAALLVAPYLVEWSERRPARDPVGYTATALLDQAAYGAGVLAGCLRGRTTVPLRPRTR